MGCDATWLVFWCPIHHVSEISVTFLHHNCNFDTSGHQNRNMAEWKYAMVMQQCLVNLTSLHMDAFQSCCLNSFMTRQLLQLKEKFKLAAVQFIFTYLIHYLWCGMWLIVA